MADPLYLRGGSGYWGDPNAWSETDGGGPAARAPNTTTDAYCTAASGATTLIIPSGSWYGRSLVCNGFEGSLRFLPTSYLNLYGTTCILSSAMTVSHDAASAVLFVAPAGTACLTTAGKVLFLVYVGCGGIFQLQDPLDCHSLIRAAGVFDPNGQKVTIRGNGSSPWLILGGLASGNALYDLELIPDTPISGQFASLGSDIAVTHDLTINGGATYPIILKSDTPGTPRALTVGGNISMLDSTTFTDVAPTVTGTTTLAAGKTLKAAYGLTFTSAAWDLTGTSGSPITLSSDDGANAATLAKSGGGTVTAEYCTVSYLTASPAATFLALNSTDGGNNTNWTFNTNRYLVAEGNWSSYLVWASTSGATAGAIPPSVNDNAYLNAASGAVALTVDVSVTLASFDCSGFTGTLLGSL